MKTWSMILKSVAKEINRLRDVGCPDPFFRGHSNHKWQLMPSLGRKKHDLEIVESRLYEGFRTLGGHLLRPGCSTWEILFLMQHHALPTRLLDWTESFAVALFFALRHAKSSAAVWILNPYALNLKTMNYESVEYLDSAFPDGYAAYFIEDHRKELSTFPAPIVSLATSRIDPRMQWQRAVFTLHADLSKPIEKIYPSCVTKIEIPFAHHSAAREFLLLAGINEAAVFPDLDGVARYLCEMELSNT